MPMCLLVCVCVRDSCWVKHKDQQMITVKTDYCKKQMSVLQIISNQRQPFLFVSSCFASCLCIQACSSVIQASGHVNVATDGLCACVFLFPSFFSIILPLVPFCVIYTGEREAGDKKGKYWETEWAVTLYDAICYPQRIASGLLTYSIHLSTLVLINQMPLDV